MNNFEKENIEHIVRIVKNRWGSLKRNKITTSALKKTLQYIKKTLDHKKLFSHEYTCLTLTKICANSVIRYPAIGGILCLKQGPIPQESKEFIDSIQFNIDKIREIRGLVKSKTLPFVNTTSTECLNLIYSLVKDEKTFTKSSEEIFNVLYNLYKPQESYVSLKSLIAYTCFFLKDRNALLSESLDAKYKRFIQDSKATSDIIFARGSLWKKNLIEHLRKINSARLSKTSAYPEVTLRKILSKNVLLMKHIETYINMHYDNVPTSIDALHWFFNTASIQSLKDTLVYIANNLIIPDNNRIKSKHAKHHAYDFIKSSIIFFRDRIPFYMGCKDDLHALNTVQLLGMIDDQREMPCENVRRHFYDGEVRDIMNEVKNDVKYTLIFTILREIGLRIGAVCTLKTKHFVNHRGVYLDTCRKMEKGKKFRTFPISDNLKANVKAHLDTQEDIKNNPEAYLFSSQNGKHISADSVRNKLVRITEKLGIHGQHVHPHAFRHTIVNNLMARGNKLENVSKFMGHSSISTTEQYYWTTELENILPTMNIPWLNGSNGVPSNISNIDDPDGELVEHISVDLLVGILGVYHNVINDTQKHLIKEKIPNIEEIFASVCEYSISSCETNSESIGDFI